MPARFQPGLGAPGDGAGGGGGGGEGGGAGATALGVAPGDAVGRRPGAGLVVVRRQTRQLHAHRAVLAAPRKGTDKFDADGRMDTDVTQMWIQR